MKAIFLLNAVLLALSLSALADSKPNKSQNFPDIVNDAGSAPSTLVAGTNFCITRRLETTAKVVSPVGLVPETAPSKYVIINLGNVDNITVEEFFVPFIKAVPSEVEILSLGGLRTWMKEKYPDLWGRVQKLPITHGSQWTRDFIPEVVQNPNGEPSMTSFVYERTSDPDPSRRLAHAFGVDVYHSPLKLEGGNLVVDDGGNLFLTEKIISQNAPLKTEDIEAELKKALQIKAVHWMPVLTNEPTGHIDMYAKYVGKNRFLVSDSTNPQIKSELDNIAEKFKVAGYDVFRVTNEGTGFHSYTNSLILNNTALIPGFADTTLSPTDYDYASSYVGVLPFDKEAKEVYESLGFSTQIIPSRGVICNGGAVHCLTKQISTRVNLTK